MRLLPQRYCRHVIMGIVYMFHSGFFAIPMYAQELQWKVFGHLQESRVGFCAAAIGYGKVLVIGGFSEQRGNQNHRVRGSVTSSCEMIDIKSRRITSASSMHSPHAFACVLQTKDSSIVIISGLNTDSITTPVCEMYDRKKNEWRVLGSLLIGRHQHSAAFLNDEEIIVVGGIAKYNYGASIAEAEVLNIRTGQSRFVDDFPDKCCFGVSISSRIFFSQSPLFFGGRGESGISYHLSNMYCFDKVSSHWVRLGTFPEAMCALSFQRLFDGRLIVSGGRKKDNTVSANNIVQSSNIYLENPGGFSFIGLMLRPRSWSSLEQWNNDILLIIGGSDNGRVSLSRCEWFDLQTHQSIEGPAMNEARNSHTSVSFPTFDNQGRQEGACILVVGGFDAQNRSLSSVEILETTNPQLLEVPNPEIASQRLKKLLTSPTVIATLAGFILILIAGLIYLLYQVLIIRRQSKFSYQSNAVGGHK